VEGQESSEIIRVERQGFDTLQLPINKSWTISLEQMHIVFPNNYNFAAAFEQVMDS